MKSRHDLVAGYMKKAQSDMANLDMCIKNNCALDTACFHAQQAAEKVLKALLLYDEIQPPRTHNLMQLVNMAAKTHPDFENVLDQAALLTPYAVEMRYDEDFWPSLEDALDARKAAIDIRTVCEKTIESPKTPKSTKKRSP